MGSSDLGTDLSLERLQPASSVHALQTHPAKRDGEDKPRRRPSQDEHGTEDESSEASDQPQHKVDSLA